MELEIVAYFETIKEEAMIFPNDVPCVIVGRHTCKKLGHADKMKDHAGRSHTLSRWSRRKSARVMDQMRKSIERTTILPAESQPKQQTQRTHGGPGVDDGREKAEELSEKDEEVEIVREITKSVNNSREKSEKVRESAVRQNEIAAEQLRVYSDIRNNAISELNAAYDKIKNKLSQAADVSNKTRTRIQKKLFLALIILIR